MGDKCRYIPEHHGYSLQVSQVGKPLPRWSRRRIKVDGWTLGWRPSKGVRHLLSLQRPLEGFEGWSGQNKHESIRLRSRRVQDEAELWEKRENHSNEISYNQERGGERRSFLCLFPSTNPNAIWENERIEKTSKTKHEIQSYTTRQRRVRGDENSPSGSEEWSVADAN